MCYELLEWQPKQVKQNISGMLESFIWAGGKQGYFENICISVCMGVISDENSKHAKLKYLKHVDTAVMDWVGNN